MGSCAVRVTRSWMNGSTASPSTTSTRPGSLASRPLGRVSIPRAAHAFSNASTIRSTRSTAGLETRSRNAAASRGARRPSSPALAACSARRVASVLGCGCRSASGTTTLRSGSASAATRSRTSSGSGSSGRLGWIVRTTGLGWGTSGSGVFGCRLASGVTQWPRAGTGMPCRAQAFFRPTSEMPTLAAASRIGIDQTRACSSSRGITTVFSPHIVRPPSTRASDEPGTASTQVR